MMLQFHSKLTVFAAIVLSCCSFANAYRPELVSSTPRGMQRGTTQKVVVEGVRLSDSRQLLLDYPGINVVSLKPLDDKTVEVELEVPSSTKPGLYPMRVVSETGLSNVLMFGVGALPNVDEVEPNSDFASPQVIENNVTIEGSVAREDEDYYSVTLKQGERLTVELEGVRIKKGRSNPFFDPYVAILNSERFELATSDDAPLLQQDCLCSIKAPADGQYLIVVRDSSFGGNNDRYRMHVGSFPRPIAVVPAGGAPGELVEMTFIDSLGDAWVEKVQLPSEQSDAFPVVVEDDFGVAPSPNFVRVQSQSNVLEVEPNNSYKEATVGTLPAAFTGIIGEPGDDDFFGFEAKKGQTVRLKLFARKTLRSQLDGVVNVYNATGGRVGGNDDSGGLDSSLDYKIPEDGIYHVGINDHLRGGGPAFSYRLEATFVEPELVLTLPDRQRYVATQVNVAQGNRTAVMLNASRRGIAGPIDLECLNLPVGVTLTPLQMPANRSTVPFLLTAAADAPLDGRLVNVVGKIPENPIQGRFTQQHQMLIGLNNNVVNDYKADRAAIAVIKSMPCTIEIVAPKVPIVRNGSMGLVVKINRGDLDADVPIRMLYNPPGIGSSGSIKIPKGKDEAVIPLTANGSAAIGQWPIIVYASVAGNEIASEPVMLDVQDKLFNFTFPKTSAELSSEATVIVEVEVMREFAGNGEIELLGLPAGVVCEQTKMPVTQETEQLAYRVKIEEGARVGQHKSIVARATVTNEDGEIRQTLGTGTLQVDKPLPAPVAKKEEPKAMETPKAEAPKPVQEKPLSRLEQLRLLKKQQSEE